MYRIFIMQYNPDYATWFCCVAAIRCRLSNQHPTQLAKAAIYIIVKRSEMKFLSTFFKNATELG